MFVLADALTSRIAYIFSQDKSKGEYRNEVAQPWHYYPELYKDDQNAVDEMLEKQKMEAARQSRKDFAERWNKRFRGE